MTAEAEIRASLAPLVSTGLVPPTSPDRVIECWSKNGWRDGMVKAGKWYPPKDSVLAVSPVMIASKPVKQAKKATHERDKGGNDLFSVSVKIEKKTPWTPTEGEIY